MGKKSQLFRNAPHPTNDSIPDPIVGNLSLLALLPSDYFHIFFLFSDSFDEFIAQYANAASTDIEKLKDVPVTYDKINHAFEVIYEKFINIKSSLTDFF